MQFHLCEFVTLYHLVASSVFSHFYFSINWTMGNTHYTHWYHCCWCCCYTCNSFFHSWWFFDNVPRDRITAQHISVNYYEKEIFSTDTNNWCGTDLLIPLIIVSFSVCSLSNCQHLIHAHICQSITRSLSLFPFLPLHFGSLIRLRCRYWLLRVLYALGSVSLMVTIIMYFIYIVNVWLLLCCWFYWYFESVYRCVEFWLNELQRREILLYCIMLVAMQNDSTAL